MKRATREQILVELKKRQINLNDKEDKVTLNIRTLGASNALMIITIKTSDGKHKFSLTREDCDNLVFLLKYCDYEFLRKI